MWVVCGWYVGTWYVVGWYCVVVILLRREPAFRDAVSLRSSIRYSFSSEFHVCKMCAQSRPSAQMYLCRYNMAVIGAPTRPTDPYTVWPSVPSERGEYQVSC